MYICISYVLKYVCIFACMYVSDMFKGMYA